MGKERREALKKMTYPHILRDKQSESAFFSCSLLEVRVAVNTVVLLG